MCQVDVFVSGIYNIYIYIHIIEYIYNIYIYTSVCIHMYLWHETSLVASWILFFLYKVVLCADVLRCLFLAWCNFLRLLPFSMFVWDLQCWYLCCGLSSMSSRTCYTSWNMIAINYIVYSSLSIQIYWSVLTSTSKYTYNYVYCVVLLNYIFCGFSFPSFKSLKLSSLFVFSAALLCGCS